MANTKTLAIFIAGIAAGLNGCGGSGNDSAPAIGNNSVTPAVVPTVPPAVSDGAAINVASNAPTGIPEGSAVIVTGTGAGANGASTGGATASGAGNSGTTTGGTTTGSTSTGGTPTGGTSTGSDCSGIISRCFDLTAAQIAKYKGKKDAAASYTFDDGYASSTKIATIFESAGLRATFYINPGNVPSANWPVWKGLAAKGHEIGNHSMTHTIVLAGSTVSDQTLDTEINGAQRLIEQQIGIKPLTFAFPWHQYDDRSLRVANQNHFSVRKLDIGEPNYRFVYFDRDHTVDLAHALDDANKQLSDRVTAGGWMVAGGHGVDGDGWSPVTSKFLQDHLAFASRFSSRLWIDTYLNVARYRLCRDQVKPTVTVPSASKAIVQLTGSFNTALCTAPLTVSIPVKETLRGQLQVRNAAGADIPVTVSGTFLLLDLRPGDSVNIDLTRSAN
jgi:peptidoglycan/xylan/chitin deacetylase (PgdA/CDA1 family)